jgi:hypothetical protein
MHYVWRRYAKSGYAPPWFYGAIAAGFAALCVWAIVRQDWVVAVIAAAMLPLAIGGSMLMRRFSTALDADDARFAGRDDPEPHQQPEIEDR